MGISVNEQFRPPWWLRNAHVQTLLGHWLLGPKFGRPTVRRLLTLDDGDQLVLHDSIPSDWKTGDRIVILVHGLAGCYDSGHLRRFARLFANQQIRTVRLDQRGCGAGLLLARKTYHAGRSEDVLAVVNEVHRWSPTSEIILLGVSLGGNVVLKMAGEVRANPPEGLKRVISLAPPIDMQRCSALIAKRENRLYEKYFVGLLIKQIQTRRNHFTDLPKVQFQGRTSLRQFDNLITAPVNGFTNADDYYDRVSALPLIDRIQLPTLIMTARDDPFIAPEPFDELRLPKHIELHIPEYGGHVAFLGSDGNGGYRWAERRVVEWALQN